KRLQGDVIPRIPYAEAMERYGSDKPDLRYDIELIELTDVFADTDFAVFKTAETIKAIRVERGCDLTPNQIDLFTEIAMSEGAGGLAYIIVEENELRSPIAKFMSDAEKAALLDRTGAQPGDAIFFGADERATVNKVLGKLRIAFADHFELKDPNVVALAWIVD